MPSRHLIVHSAHGAIGVAQCSPAGFEAAGATFPRDWPGPLRVALLYSRPRRRRDGSIDALEAALGLGGDVVGTSGLLGCGGAGLPQQILEESSCVVLYGRWPKSAERRLGRIERLCRRGRGVVVIGSRGDGRPAGPVERLAGACTTGHHPRDWFPRIEIEPGAGHHPVLDGVEPFSSRGPLASQSIVARTTKILLTGTVGGLSEPVAWARIFHRGRVVCTSLDHPDDLRQPSYQRLVRNAVWWAAEGELPGVW